MNPNGTGPAGPHYTDSEHREIMRLALMHPTVENAQIRAKITLWEAYRAANAQLAPGGMHDPQMGD